jgi:glycerol-3-phosphate acyltransferase PlsY
MGACEAWPLLVESDQNLTALIAQSTKRISVYDRSVLRRPSNVLISVAIGAGYFIGTFPTAAMVARRASGGAVDLREAGSGNPGSANALDVLGAKAGATVLTGDITKGALACGLGGLIAGSAGAHLAGTAAVAGHCYPVWNGFKGGKGVATSVGQCLATFPAYFPIDVVVAIATAANPRWKQRAFAAAVVSSACWVAGSVVWWRRGWSNAWGPRPTSLLPVASLLSTSMIVKRFLDAA